MGDPPSKGAVQVMSTLSPFIVVVGALGVTGKFAALIETSADSTL